MVSQVKICDGHTYSSAIIVFSIETEMDGGPREITMIGKTCILERKSSRYECTDMIYAVPRA